MGTHLQPSTMTLGKRSLCGGTGWTTCGNNMKGKGLWGCTGSAPLIWRPPQSPAKGRLTVPCSLVLQTAQHNRVCNEVSLVSLTQERPNHLREHSELCRAQELGVVGPLAPNIPWAGLSRQSSVHTNMPCWDHMLHPKAPICRSLPLLQGCQCAGDPHGHVMFGSP